MSKLVWRTLIWTDTASVRANRSAGARLGRSFALLTCYPVPRLVSLLSNSSFLNVMLIYLLPSV